MAIISNHPYELKGTIYDQYNLPLAIVHVKAYDKDMRSFQLLGEAITDNNGSYLIQCHI